MNMDDEEYSPFSFGSGCGIHGEDYMHECSLCGIEFCAACFPRSGLCADCAAQAAFDDEEDAEPTDDEKDLLLLGDFNDDEPSELMEEPEPGPLKKKAKAKSKAAAPTKAKAQPQATAKPKAQAKPKAKPAKPASKKRKA